MNQIAKTILGLLLLGTGLAGAQENQDVHPPNPLYHPSLVGDMSFTKRITYKTPGANKELNDEQKAAEQFQAQFGKVKRMDVVQTGNIRRDRFIFDNGNDHETWRWGNSRFSVYDSHPNLILVNIVSDTGYQDMPDFPELQWITGKAFQGMEKQNGTECYFYKEGPVKAWISTATLLPVSFESDTQEVSYSYRKPPSTPLQLPQKFHRKLEEINKAWSGR